MESIIARHGVSYRLQSQFFVDLRELYTIVRILEQRCNVFIAECKFKTDWKV